MHFGGDNAFIREAVAYTEQHFANNYGTTSAPFEANGTPQYYPCTHAAAEQALEKFIEHKLANFGVYEDAMQMKETALFHSVLSPLLNIGLLNPLAVINRLIAGAETHQVPLNSVEGIVRQLLGWREFVQLTYQKIGSIQRTKNFWGFTHHIPKAFYTGTTGLPPIDSTIKKLLHSGYNHHIERLMILGNFMLLCEFHPDAIYRWFMEMFVDAYDWVMVPNVYGMSQHADGGLITTKPYISGSSYVLKMSDYKKGDWTGVWDGLYWRFVSKHRDFFERNPRMKVMVSQVDRMGEKLQVHQRTADAFLSSL
jgi:deoxyribodipyrimidine photolyase-related protein